LLRLPYLVYVFRYWLGELSAAKSSREWECDPEGKDFCAATAASRDQELRSRCLEQSSHRLTQQHGGINDRYREGCSHPAWQATG